MYDTKSKERAPILNAIVFVWQNLTDPSNQRLICPTRSSTLRMLFKTFTTTFLSLPIPLRALHIIVDRLITDSNRIIEQKAALTSLHCYDQHPSTISKRGVCVVAERTREGRRIRSSPLAIMLEDDPRLAIGPENLLGPPGKTVLFSC